MLINVMGLVTSFLGNSHTTTANDRVLSLVIVKLVVEEGFLLLAELALRRFLATLLSDEVFQLLCSHLSDLYHLFCLSVDPIISIKLLLELNDGLISLIESASESYHDISLL